MELNVRFTHHINNIFQFVGLLPENKKKRGS